MTSTQAEASRVVAVPEALVRARAAELVGKGGDSRVLVLRAQPRWRGGDLEVSGERVRVIEGISQLAILDAYERHDGEYLVVLTDRPRADLGDTVVARAYRQQIENPDEWGSVPALFGGAREVGRDLRRLEWAATALLDHEPAGGWAPSTDLAVSAEHAVGGLLAHLLGIGIGGLDGVIILTALSNGARGRWAAVEPGLQRHLTDWAEQEYGTAAAFALRAAAAPGGLVKPLALGLAVDVLWPTRGDAPSEDQVAARTRLIERYAGGHPVTPVEARNIAAASHTAVLRLTREGDSDGRLGVVLDQAEALLRDNLGWAAGAERSIVLRPGFTARLRALAAALDKGSGVEEALATVVEHREATLDGQDAAPRMAVRLSRWLDTPEATTATLGQDLQRQIDDGAWVDAALGVVWSGAHDPEVAGAYGRLIERVRARRATRDAAAAARLGDSPLTQRLGEALAGEGVLGIESVLHAVVSPWKAVGGVLLVVLDGMSAAIAVDLANDVTRSGLVEWVPARDKRRATAVAALPSLTGISRTSLFVGEITQGTSANEKAGLAAVFPGSRVFHKGELRAAGGAQLADEVAGAIADPKVPVVGVVINAIDDATHKNDTASRPWVISELEPLRALLNAASIAGRAVVLTSDHGHVVERGTTMRPIVGGDSRWRPVSSGAAGEGEVVVAGPRVGLPDREAVLLWRDDARYGPARAGYHGGGSLAEITVPVLVFQRSLAQEGPGGWVAAPPQAPGWWNDPVVVAPEKPAPAPAPKSRRKPVVETSLPTLFEVENVPAAPAAARDTDLVAAVLGSDVYADQLRLAGRAGAGAAPLVEAVLRTLVARDGRAHQDTVASAVGVPSTAINQSLAVVKRVLNVEGYDILGLDSDGVTLRLDLPTLKEQFGVAG